MSKFVLDTVRLRIARLLASFGPGKGIQGDDAAHMLGLSLDQWWEAVTAGQSNPGRYHPWFTPDAPGVFGWTLTKRGRREALASVGSATVGV